MIKSKLCWLIFAAAVLTFGVQAQGALIAQFSGNITTNASGQVSAWRNDVSGGSSAVNASTATQPYVATAVINGQNHSVIDFGANSSAGTVLSLGPQSALNARPVSFAVVFKYTSSTTAQSLFGVNDTVSSSAMQGWIRKTVHFAPRGEIRREHRLVPLQRLGRRMISGM